MIEVAEQAEILPMHIHRAANLTDFTWLSHGVTRRVRGAGSADGNVGYSAPRDREDAWRMRRAWMKAAELDANDIVVAYQTHGSDVIRVGAEDLGKGADPESRPIGHADGLITNQPGPVLMTLHADCMPILLCDPVNRAVATVHAGWRGTVADVAGSTVRAMREAFGSQPSEILAYLGPAIGGCCYEVGADVEQAWRAAISDAAGDELTQGGDRWRFDLEVANRAMLERAELDPAHIETSRICTRCSGDEWFSHRGQGSATGRYGSFVTILDN